MRDIIKVLIRLWPWPLTLNERYDRQTKAVIRKVCEPASVCIDVGCYKGDILQWMIQSAPEARHMAFEPIPEQYKHLKKTFGEKADIFPFALGAEDKDSSFQHVITNPTYSGLKQRQYKREEEIREIAVRVRQLDDVFSSDRSVRLIKIDVEGGEFDVIKGARETIRKWKPYIIFEHGIGGSDKYGVNPADMYQLLVDELDYKICLMGDFLKNENVKGFSLVDFENQYTRRLNCYFMAIKNG